MTNMNFRRFSDEKSMERKKFTMKVLFIAGIMVAVVILIFSLLQFLGILENAGNIYIPGLSVLMFIQTAENWKDNRHTAIISLFAGVFIFAIVAVRFTLL